MRREADPLAPLSWDTSGDPTAFSPGDWATHRAAVTGLPTPLLPERAVLTCIPSLLDLVTAAGAERHDLFGTASLILVSERAGMPFSIGLTPKGSGAAAALDQLHSLGARHVVFLGGCGALVERLAVGTCVVPTAALRDDGVSLAYLPPSRYVSPDAGLTAAVSRAAGKHFRSVEEAACWTTVAHFRETVTRVAAFAEEGCSSVNNEAAGVFAAAQALGVRAAGAFLVGDSIAEGRFEMPREEPDPSPLLDLALEALAQPEAV